MKFAEYAKMYMALGGGIATGALGLTDIPGSWKLPLELVVVAGTAVATWVIPNRDPNEFEKQYFEGQ